MKKNPTCSVYFDDAATSVMGEAFDRSCETLENLDTILARVPILIRKAMAIRILEDATFGERDGDRLHAHAIELFGVVSPSVSEGRDRPISASA